MGVVGIYMTLTSISATRHTSFLYYTDILAILAAVTTVQVKESSKVTRR